MIGIAAVPRRGSKEQKIFKRDPSVEEYGTRLTERQDAEIAIYERAKTDCNRRTILNQYLESFRTILNGCLDLCLICRQEKWYNVAHENYSQTL